MRPIRPILACTLFLTLPACASDKTMHFVAGAAAAKYTTHLTNRPASGCAAAFALGLAKEGFDRRRKGVVDKADALATAAGCLYTIRF